MIILMEYYSKKLSTGRLRQIYDLAPDGVRRYLESERGSSIVKQS